MTSTSHDVNNNDVKSFWQSKTLYLAIVNDLPLNKRSFAIAAYPVCERTCQYPSM